MNKRQKLLSLLFLIFSVVFISVPYSSLSQEVNHVLTKADSLFKEKKYTESFELYAQILESDHQATDQMLLKMAYIKEGLGDYSEALLYLNKYYRHSADKRARYKMEDIAQEKQLFGYTSDDTEFIVGYVNRNAIVFYMIVFSVILFLLFVIVYRKLKSKTNATPYAIGALVLLVLFWFAINFQLAPARGIVIDSHAYLMSAPSSGADLVEVIDKGHRVKVLDQTDVWTKISWQEKEVYIRNEKIKLVAS
ncbi:SH3 domain-containing protein [Reichenbachiella versicolor]|uniref:SH3 domain-containing protein n=1 Tax=Reichenbachiella versicolor TaxID=1821036 RepID=UPI000D6E1C92|nr:SH3 domain-containing protein [Reichenbachiella versicolor]